MRECEDRVAWSVAADTERRIFKLRILEDSSTTLQYHASVRTSIG